MDDKPGEQTAVTPEPIAGATVEPIAGATVEPIAVTPDMRLSSADKGAAPAPVPAARRRRLRPVLMVAGVAALVGLASLATTVWIYTEMRREILRVSTDLAQLRLSLDLYAQRNAAVPVPDAASADTSALEALQNRLTILEENWRSSAGATPSPAALPPIGGPTVTAESDGDCLPSGMRLLVAAGDAYPVCGTDATVEVMNVSNGYISLTDGTTVPSGGSVPLNGTACMIGVTSGGDEATTGFAEIRVSC